MANMMKVIFSSNCRNETSFRRNLIGTLARPVHMAFEYRKPLQGGGGLNEPLIGVHDLRGILDN
jgi:hypothetical protein